MTFEGDKSLVAENVDLDYLNVRQWRDLFLPLLKEQNRFHMYLVIPVDNKVFPYAWNKLLASENNYK